MFNVLVMNLCAFVFFLRAHLFNLIDVPTSSACPNSFLTDNQCFRCNFSSCFLVLFTWFAQPGSLL